MATTYKSFLDNDVVSTRTLLHENIPITGSIVSSSVYNGSNIKSYTHGMFQSVYDYPWQSSSANQLFDMTVGISPKFAAPWFNSTDTEEYNKKVNTYNQMAQVLLGYDSTGSIYTFDRDGDQAGGSTSDKFYHMYFLNFNRLLVKDEIKKGTFEIEVGVTGAVESGPTVFTDTIKIVDASGSTNNFINSPVGEYGILYAKNGDNDPLATAQANKEVGLIFYQAGVVALSTNIFAKYDTTFNPTGSVQLSTQGQLALPTQAVYFDDPNNGSPWNEAQLFASGTVDDINKAFRDHIKNITFQNTTELNSSIYFCRINHNEFNYSSNPTYLSGSQIYVKNTQADAPVSYITTVGLYSPDNELLAVAKLSEPIRKDPQTELILRTRLDF